MALPKRPGYPLCPSDLRGTRRSEGPVDLALFNKYERHRPDVDAAIGRLFLQGLSTQRLRSIAQELFGCEVSDTTVSKTIGYLDEELWEHQIKPISDNFSFLFMDGTTQKVIEIRVKKKVMLCALGMKKDSAREMLSFRLADHEDVDSWWPLLIDLKSCGLQGTAPRLITTDGNPALLKAIKKVYPFLKVQRCMFTS